MPIRPDESVDAPAPAGLVLTGERTLPGIRHENYWFRRHEAAYRALIPGCTGTVVLEAGCGEGYGGALLLAAGACRVLAVDYDRDTVTHVRRTYPQQDVLRANLVALPLTTASVDAVVSLQVLEHLWDQPRFVAECARVLRPGGWLALSTPNRLTFSPGVGRGEKPLNPFHTNELDAEELVELVSARLDVEGVLGLRHGARLRAWEHTHGSLVAAQLAAPAERWHDALSLLVGGVTAEDFELTAHDVDAALDLLLLARRPA
jgi:SAM-dependent methyltransferase